MGKILYYTSSAVSSGNLCNTYALRSVMAFDFRYSSNCGTTLAAYKSLYLKGTVSDDGLFYLSDTPWYTQTLPTEDDGFVYIYIGETYSTTNVHLSPVHPIYWYKNGAIREYGKIGTNKVITGTKTITISDTRSAIASTLLTTKDLGFTPNENTSILVSVREYAAPYPSYLNVYTTYYQEYIYLCLSVGASTSEFIPSGTYYIDYIVINNS